MLRIKYNSQILVCKQKQRCRWLGPFKAKAINVVFPVIKCPSSKSLALTRLFSLISLLYYKYFPCDIYCGEERTNFPNFNFLRSTHFFTNPFNNKEYCPNVPPSSPSLYAKNCMTIEKRISVLNLVIETLETDHLTLVSKFFS